MKEYGQNSWEGKKPVDAVARLQKCWNPEQGCFLVPVEGERGLRQQLGFGQAWRDNAAAPDPRSTFQPGAKGDSEFQSQNVYVNQHNRKFYNYLVGLGWNPVEDGVYYNPDIQ